jgi:LysM repeat protein
MRRRARRSPARFLAPLALIAVVVALLAIINGSDTNAGSAATDTPTLTTPGVANTTSGHKSKTSTVKSTTTNAAGSPKTYTVVVGDTLGSIATKTGVSLDQIQTLNPDVDPHAMVAGQVIKLR